MPFDVNGNYSAPPGTEGVTGQIIDSAAYNAFLADLEAALNQVMFRNGLVAAAANLPMGGFRITGMADGTNPQDAVTKAQHDLKLNSNAVSVFGATLIDDANATAAQQTLGGTVVGRAVFTAADAAAARAAIGGTATGVVLFTAADEPAARAAIGAVPTSRAITAGGLATGGGDLSANRTITVTESSQVQAEEGTDTTTAMTPLRVKQAMRANGSAPMFACRAWVNFNGTGTVAIRASGNVSSITDNGVGDYTVNFTTAMPDANYAPLAQSTPTDGSTTRTITYGQTVATQLAASWRLRTHNFSAFFDPEAVTVSIFR